MNHVVMFSGGVGSWAAAKRVAEKHGTNNLKLLFTDTKIEDEDLYRFITEAAENVGGELVVISDGRTPWQVFKDNKFMANSRVDICSRVLKRELADKWVYENYPDPKNVRLYTGIDWTESHRQERMAVRKLPYIYEAPMCEEPYIIKPQMLRWLQEEGIEIPNLYKLGFQHNNCGSFCIKAGQAHFKKVFETMPERYKKFEKSEQEVFEVIGKPAPFLRIIENGEKRYISLRDFRLEYLEQEGKQIDLFDFGGCGCFGED